MKATNLTPSRRMGKKAVRELSVPGVATALVQWALMEYVPDFPPHLYAMVIGATPAVTMAIWRWVRKAYYGGDPVELPLKTQARILRDRQQNALIALRAVLNEALFPYERNAIGMEKNMDAVLQEPSGYELHRARRYEDGKPWWAEKLDEEDDA